MTARFVLNQGNVRDLLKSRNGAVGRDLLRRSIRVESRAKQLAPVDTGRLRNSVTHALGVERGAVVGYVGTNVDYVLPVHEGHVQVTRNGGRIVPGKPFLRDALPAAGR